MAIFGLKPWFNPLGKMSIFRLCNFLFLQPRKVFFLFLEYRRRHFPGLYCLKKIWKNVHFWTNIMVYPVWKNVNFGLLNFLFLQPRKALFVLEYRKRNFIVQTRVFFVVKYRKRHFPCLYCLKKQVEIMVIFGQKPLVNPFVKMSTFRLF